MWNFAIPIAMAAMGANSAQRKADQQKKYNIGQAETTRYSPWTGQSGRADNSYSPSALEGGVSGGIQGMGAVQSLGLGLGKSDWTEAPPTATSTAPMMANGMQNAFGGTDMSQQLGMQGQMFQNGFKPNLYAGR